MSVDAKLFVTCGKDRMFDIIGAVVKQLNIYSRAKLDSYIEDSGLMNRIQYKGKEHDKKYSNGCRFNGHNPEVISFIFGSGDLNFRRLGMFCDCSLDYTDSYKGAKVIFSIGHWGACDEIMQELITALKPFGDVYYDHNDCDDEGFVKV